MGKASFDDYLSMVEEGQDKTASLNTFADSGILAKLAEEITSGSAPTAEGEVVPAASTIEAAAPAVVGQTEAVQAPQLALAGGDAAEAAAGEATATTKPNQGVVISAGDGTTNDVNSLGRTEAATAKAAEGGGGSTATATEEEKTAAALGDIIASHFLSGIAKHAEDQEYAQATVILKQAGLLDGYQINDVPELSKTASQEDGTLGLEKIASGVALSREDMVKAASEFIEYTEMVEEEAQIKEAQEYGVALAHEYADGEMAKEAAQVESFRQNPEVLGAVAVLKSHGLI